MTAGRSLRSASRPGSLATVLVASQFLTQELVDIRSGPASSVHRGVHHLAQNLTSRTAGPLNHAGLAPRLRCEWARLGSNQLGPETATRRDTPDCAGLQDKRAASEPEQDSGEQACTSPPVDSSGTTLPFIHEGQLTAFDGSGEGDERS